MTSEQQDVKDEPSRRRAVRRRATRMHRRRRRRRLPPVRVAPTLLTLGNLIAGFAAIHYAAKPLDFTGPWGWSSLTLAGALIFLGMFLDSIDGSVARLTRSSSDLGTQLDSLADLVTCGVAPAFMMLRLVSHYLPPDGETMILGPEADNAFAKIVWGVAAVYVCCACMRLARFNIEVPGGAVEDHMVFRGLPSPGAAGAIASLIVLHQHVLHESQTSPEDVSVLFARWTAFGMPLVTLLCAVAMVSSIPYVHIMNRYVRGRRSFAYVARLVIPLFLAIWWFQEMLALAFTLYTVYPPLRMTASRLRGRRPFPAFASASSESAPETIAEPQVVPSQPEPDQIHEDEQP
ncbi:MAG: phosphatidylcholine/phosphatidylserine synthase [Phycisphaerales bacterium]|nr:MAG: phosphatidylcholine/phosphatidylserine synthase [Phycisphaerales bacterium]